MKALSSIGAPLSIAVLLFLSVFQAFSQENVLNVNQLDSVYQSDFDALIECDNDISIVAGWTSVVNGAVLNYIPAYATNCNKTGKGTVVFNSKGDYSIGFRPESGSNHELSLTIKNTTNRSVKQIGVFFTGEQWYKGNSNNDAIILKVGVGSSFQEIKFNTVNNSAFEALQFCNNGDKKCKGLNENLDGNVDENQKKIQLSIPLEKELFPDEYVVLKWSFIQDQNATDHHGLSIDDVGVTLHETTSQTWYLLSTANDPSKAKSWTILPNDTESIVALNDDKKGGISDSNKKFIVNYPVDLKSNFNFSGDSIELHINAPLNLDKSDLLVSGNACKIFINNTCSTNSEVKIDGQNSKLIISDNKRFDVFKKGNEKFWANVTVKENAFLNYYRDVKNNQENGFVIDTCYDGSVVLFDNLTSSKDIQIIPKGSYYSLRVNDSSDKLKREIITNGAIVVRKEFSYYPRTDLLTDDFGFTFRGDSCVVNTPNYSGQYLFKSVTVAMNSTLYLGNLYYDQFSNMHLMLEADFLVETNAKCIVRENQSLILEGDKVFNHSGVIYINNNASFILDEKTRASGDGITYISRNQPFPNSQVLNHWSSPVKKSTIGKGGNVNGKYNYYYLNGEQANSDYRRFSGLRTMDVGRGYSAVGNAQSTFVAHGVSELNYGRILYHGVEEEDGDYDSENFYLLGNPYASGISAVQFLEENAKELLGTIYLFSQVNEFGAYSRSGDNIAVNYMGNSDYGSQTDSLVYVENFEDFIIASGQGFFVIDKTPETQDINISFSREMQSGINDNFKSKVSSKHQYWVVINDESNYASSLLVFADGVITKMNEFDAPRVPNSSVLSIWTIKNKRDLSIQSLPVNDSLIEWIPIGVDVSKPGKYDLELKSNNALEATDFHLYDKKLNIYHPIENGKYSFSTTESENLSNRFFLSKKRNSPNENLSVMEEENSCGSNLNEMANGRLQLKGEEADYLFYTINGEQLQGVEIVNGESSYALLPKGLTIVKHTTNVGQVCVYKYFRN